MNRRDRTVRREPERCSTRDSGGGTGEGKGKGGASLAHGHLLRPITESVVAPRRTLAPFEEALPRSVVVSLSSLESLFVVRRGLTLAGWVRRDVCGAMVTAG